MRPTELQAAHSVWTSSLAVGLLVAAGSTSAFGGWTIVNLHPAGAVSSEAKSVHAGQQSGVTGVSQGALLWKGSAGSVKALSPAGTGAASNSNFGAFQGGSITVGTGINARNHAALWGGTAASLVDLHPGADVAVHTSVMAMDGSTQGGTFLPADTAGGTFSSGLPCMWTGTAGSFVNLTPDGFFSGEVRGVFGGQQVGATFDNFLGTACMWSGTAASFVNLQPVEALFSAAQCTDGVNQYGVIGILEPVPGLFPVKWSGTAESWELLDSPADKWGEVHATHGGYQVGYITDTDGVSNSRACMWTNGPGSYFDIHQFLPANLTESNAHGIWRHAESGTTYIVGYGLNSGTNQREAIMWVNGEGVNLITSPGAPVDGSVAAGQPMNFTVRVLNAGPVASGPTTLTIGLPSAGVAAYASATPAPANITATQVTFNLGSIGGSGGFADVSLTLTAGGAGLDAVITATATAASEVDPTNNVATASSRIQGTPCAADLDDGSGAGSPDAGVDINDLLYFLAAFESGSVNADLDNGTSTGTPDGGVDINDLLYFLIHFEAGC